MRNVRVVLTALLPLPRIDAAGLLPDVCGPRGEDAEAADCVLDAGDRRNGRHHELAGNRSDSFGDDRIPTVKSPGGLPGV